MYLHTTQRSMSVRKAPASRSRKTGACCRTWSPLATVHKAQKQQLEQPQTPNLFWPSNILAMTVKSSKGLSFEEQMTLC